MQIHFALEAWDVHYKRKFLKRNAIPTIFEHFLKKPNIEKGNSECTNDQATDNDEVDNINNNEITSIQNSEFTSEQATDSEKVNIETVINDISEPTTSSVNTLYVAEVHENKNKEDKKQELINEMYLRMINMRMTIKNLRSKNSKLQNKLDKVDIDKYKKAMREIFNDDQVNAILSKIRVRNWSKKTIQRALKLKLSCERNGYEELLKQGQHCLVLGH